MNSFEQSFALKVAIIMATRMLGLFMIFPIFSIYAQNYTNSTNFLIGLAVGIYGLTQAIFQIPFGYLSDKYGRKTLLIIGLIIFLIGSIIAANTNDIINVIIGRALQGAGAISAVLMAFLADFVSEKNRTKANAFVGIQIGVAFSLSLLIGPIIASNFGLSGVFWIIALLSIVAIIIVFTLPTSNIKAQYNLSANNIKDLLHSRLLKLDISIFFLHFILTSIFVVLPVILQKNNIINIDNNWTLYLPVILTSFILMIPMIIAAEKYQKISLVFISAILLIIISQILFYYLENNINYLLVFIILSILFSAFNTLEALLPSLIAKNAQDEKRGLAMGIFSTSQFLGSFAGGSFAGMFFHNFGANSVFLLTLFIAIIWLTIGGQKWQELIR